MSVVHYILCAALHKTLADSPGFADVGQAGNELMMVNSLSS